MYITKDDQVVMIDLINQYIEIAKQNDGENLTDIKANKIMNDFFEYADKIILGIIHAYKFQRFAEKDDLIQEARMAVLLSIHKEQFCREKGTIFNFVSVVSARNLINYTTKLNRNYKQKSNADIDVFFNNESMTYHQDYDRDFLLDDIEQILLDYFSGKPRLINLTHLLIQYFRTHRSSRFIKKDFIRYAKAYNYSSAMVNTYFELCSRAKTIKSKVREFLDTVISDNQQLDGTKIFDIKKG